MITITYNQLLLAILILSALYGICLLIGRSQRMARIRHIEKQLGNIPGEPCGKFRDDCQDDYARTKYYNLRQERDALQQFL